MCIRDRFNGEPFDVFPVNDPQTDVTGAVLQKRDRLSYAIPVSYTHLRAHETVLDLVCRLLLEKKKKLNPKMHRCESYQLVDDEHRT